jgi:GT2 family glycosyltransferase
MAEVAAARESGPEISVVIASLNSAATLLETLEGLGAQRWDRPWEIVLVDNGSTDGSPEIFDAFARRRPDLAVRRIAARPRGKPHALNAGIAAARGGAILICDADDVPGAGWLAAMAAALERHAVVAARMDFDRLNRGWVRAYRGNPQADRLEPLAFLPALLHAGGGTTGFRREVVERIGGFDPGLPCLEDTDFSIRAQLAGFPIAFVPDAVIHVRSRDDLPRIFAQSFRWGRYEMKLVARYRHEGVPRRGGWRRHFAAWRRLLSNNLRRGWRARPEAMVPAAWLRAGLGRLGGNLAGMALYRTGPYGPPASPEPACPKPLPSRAGS